MNEHGVRERLIQFIESQDMSIRSFEAAAKLSNGFVRSIVRSITVDKLLSIQEAFPQLNSYWLIRGDGDMLQKLPEKFIDTETLIDSHNSERVKDATTIKALLAENKQLISENRELISQNQELINQNKDLISQSNAMTQIISHLNVDKQ